MQRRQSRPTKKKALTDMSIRAARPDALPYAIYDTKLPNLALVVHPTGTMAFKCRYSRNGKARWFHIGSTTSVPLAEARKKAAQIMLQVDSGADPHAERLAKRNDGTFGEMIEAYIEQRGTKSMRQYESQLRKHALPRWKSLPVGEIARKDVQALFEQRKRVSPASAKLLLASISGAFAWGIHMGWPVSVNPARNIANSKLDPSLQSHSRERVLTDAEIVAFWHQWEQAGLLKCMALRTILLTGQRPGEVSVMRWEDITGNWWRMPGKPDGSWPGTKNGQAHRVWLTDDVLAMLDGVSGDRRTGLVFWTTRGNPVGHLPAAMAAACQALGITEDRATPHDLRRTFSTLVTRLGFDRDAMNRVTNHKEGGIGSVYDRHDYAAEAQAIQERVGRHIAGLLSGEAPEVIELATRR